MNVVPVANQCEHQQQRRDHYQTCGLRGINRVPRLAFGVVLSLRKRHRNIVAPASGAKLRVVVMPQGKSKLARFGVFELDFDARELRKNGVKLRLQDQPFQVLAELLQHPGEVVTREELRNKLWLSDTFVDFDHSLNTAVNKLREVLGDSASNPRFVETLARRGYRFIAPVQTPATVESSPHPTIAEPSRQLDPTPGPGPAPALHPALDVPIPHRALTRGLFALIQLMYLIFYVSALFRLHAIQNIADSFLPQWAAITLVATVMVTGGVGIPLRCYLISATGFDYQRLGEKFRQIFPLILAWDQLWAVAPFLLTQKIGLGAAFAACAALLYVPFSERTLIRMAYAANESRV
jgi:cholera toxin transcriptional activator